MVELEYESRHLIPKVVLLTSIQYSFLGLLFIGFGLAGFDTMVFWTLLLTIVLQ
jgi:hypothetical protein